MGAPERGAVGIRYLAMTDDPDQRMVAGSIDLRREVRVSGQIKAALRLSTSKPIQIALNDISVSGFRAEWPNTLHCGDSPSGSRAIGGTGHLEQSKNRLAVNL